MNQLKARRQSKGFSQKQLAEYSGVNIRQIQHFEQESHDINMAAALTVFKLARALDCEIEEILNLEQKEPKN